MFCFTDRISVAGIVVRTRVWTCCKRPVMKNKAILIQICNSLCDVENILISPRR